jgi:hypothetical protein
MLAILILSVLSLVRNGDYEINILTVQLSIFSVASISSAFARVFFNKGTQPTRNNETQEFLPSGWQFFKFLAAFFLSSFLFLLTASIFVHTSLELGILVLINSLIGVPVVVAAGLITFWLLKS